MNIDNSDCICPPYETFIEGGANYGYIDFTKEHYDNTSSTCKSNGVCPDYGKLYFISTSSSTRYDNKDLTVEYQIRAFASLDQKNVVGIGSGHNANTANDVEWMNLLDKLSVTDKKRNFTYDDELKAPVGTYVFSYDGKLIAKFPDRMVKKTGFALNKVLTYNGQTFKVTRQFTPYTIVRGSYSDEEMHGGKISLGGGCEYDAEAIFRSASPIILDLLGDGIKLTSVDNGVYFDLDADGTIDKVAWTDYQDTFDNAFLIYDKNNNGMVDNGSELFGDQSGSSTGFEELAKYDDNGDGIIDPLDGIYPILQLWVDLNKNGKVDYDSTGFTNELMKHEKANIMEISVDNETIFGEDGTVQQDEYGNTTGIAGKFKMFVEGVGVVVRQMIDAFFVTVQNVFK
jgi:hypothetical protein